MQIGSNNSLTYLEPSSWWLKIFRWLGKHQEIPYDKQYTYYGIRFFDFRLYVDDTSHIVAKSGKYIYPIKSIYEMFDYFNKREDVTIEISLDVSLEEHMKNDAPSIEARFVEFCNVLERIYKHIHFYGGYRKFDEKNLYQFSGDAPCIIRPADWSWFYRFSRKWCPFLMKRFNDMYIERYENKTGFLVLDYANRRIGY